MKVSHDCLFLYTWSLEIAELMDEYTVLLYNFKVLIGKWIQTM